MVRRKSRVVVHSRSLLILTDKPLVELLVASVEC